MIKINGKIVGYNLSTPPEFSPEKMEESIRRPETVPGVTYKLKPMGESDAMYITINNIVLNEGTEHEEVRPFEMFINSKSVDNFQWVVALTRIISAVFRKGGDFNFLVDELKSIFDPKGGYWDTVSGKSRYIPSIIAGIGYILETHIESLQGQAPVIVDVDFVDPDTDSETPTVVKGLENASLCAVCNTVAVVLMDGCPTCVECGDSKCG